MTDKVNILGIDIDNVTLETAKNNVFHMLSNGRVNFVCTPNSEIINMAQSDIELKNALCDADMLIPDGIGLIYASKILGKPLTERVTGCDLSYELFRLLNGTNYSIYLLGGKAGIPETAMEKLLEKYPKLKFAGTHHGYFRDNEQTVIDDINACRPDLLFVCLGAPLQEKWMHRNRANLKVKVMLGVGGSINIFSDTASRAPEIFCKNGIEWLYRLIKEPYRYKRMLKLPLFGLKVLFSKRTGDK